MTRDDLVEAYYEAAAEGLELSAFLESVAQGRYGPVSRADLLAFIDRIEAVVLANIADHQADMSPLGRASVETVREAAEREFLAARQWVMEHGPDA